MIGAAFDIKSTDGVAKRWFIDDDEPPRLLIAEAGRGHGRVKQDLHLHFGQRLVCQGSHAASGEGLRTDPCRLLGAGRGTVDYAMGGANQ